MSILQGTADVLRLMSRLQCGLTMTDVMRHLGLPKSSASRLLKQMSEYGFIDRDPQSLAYRPGLMLLEASHAVYRTSTLADQVEEALRGLNRETGHTGYISVLDGRDVLVLRTVPGTHALRVVTFPGTRSPAWATSTGRALLARLDDHVLAREFGQDLEGGGPNSPTSFAVLMERIAEVRQQGWSFAVEEAVPGACSVSCAVGCPQTGETLAFCLTFPASMATPLEIKQVAALLVAHARQIGRSQADERWSAD